MNQAAAGDFLKSPVTKVLGYAVIAFIFFYLGQHWSDGYQQLVFYSNNQQHQPTDTTAAASSIAISPNANKTISLTDSAAVAPARPPKPPPVIAEKFGIIDENGVMSEEFEVGDFDPDLAGTYKNLNMSVVKPEDVIASVKVKIEKFNFCSVDFSDYIPCLDNVEEINKLNSTEKGEKFERHCPGRDDPRLNCLVPPPEGYKAPIPWPRSRYKVWFSNVPHTRLVDDKGGQNWW